MKRILRKALYFGAIITAPALAVSCSDDNDAPAPKLEQKTFTGFTNLEIYYCGQLDPGHTAVIVPGKDGEAALTVYSTFDLSQLEIKGLEGNVPTAGLFPGTPECVIPLKLSAGDGCWEFSGKYETDYATTTYSGNFTDTKLTLNLPDVKLKNTSLAETILTPTPLKKNDKGLGYASTPFHIVWEIKPLPNVSIDLEDILETLVTLPCIPVYHDTAYSSIAQLLSQSLQTVALLDNGNVIIRYYGSGNGATVLLTTQGPTLQYLPVSAGHMKLYPNAEALAALLLASNPGGITVPTLPEALQPIGESFLKQLLPMLAEGIPMVYSPTATGLEIYFDPAVGSAILANLLKTVESDPVILAKVKELLAADPELSKYLPQLEQLLEQLPQIVARTTRLELGLSFVKAK